ARERQRTGCYLHGEANPAVEKTLRFAECPNVRVRNEKIIAAVCGPPTAAFGRRCMPSGEKGVKLRTIITHFPKRRGVLSGKHMKAYAAAIGGEPRLPSFTRSGNELADVSSIGIGQQDICAPSQDNMASVWGPCTMVANDFR